MSIKTKIMIGYSFLFILILFLSGMIVYNNQQYLQLTTDVRNIYLSTQTFRDVINDSVNMQTDLNNMIQGSLSLPDDTTFVKDSCVNINLRMLDWHKKYLKTNNFAELSIQQQYQVKQLLPALKATREAIVAIRKSNNTAKRILVFNNQFVSANRAIQNNLTKVLDFNYVYFSTKNKDIKQFSNKIFTYLVFTIGVVLVFIIIVLVYTNYILKPVRWLMEGVKKIKQGDLTHRVKKVSNDELGRLTSHINEMTKEMGAHREHLEEMVSERTEQVSSMNTKMISTLDELQTLNKQLVEARRIADLDMQMAVNVQKSFLEKQAPFSEEWDIAFAFTPMSGVSGDMYDFYLDDEGKLAGISLMDISGHGISSGLLSMIAKSVAQRNFKFGLDNRLSLNQTIVKMNSELITELKNIDKYLTGIILKFHSDVVEYVNAGHPDIIIRKKDKGRSFIVAPTEHEYKGKFLGIEPMYFNEKEIRSLKFRVQEGDVLCLYTDCLNESVNEQGDEFGIEGIVSTLNSIDASYTATDILNHLVGTFYRFVGTDELKDDFSVIIVRRKAK